MAFYLLEPFGAEWEAIQTGVIASTTYNVHRGKKDPARKPKDFIRLPKPKQTNKQTWEEQYNAMLVYVNSYSDALKTHLSGNK